MPMYEPKASALVHNLSDLRRCIAKGDYEGARNAARDALELAEDFDRFRIEHKYLLDRWEQRHTA